jgi:hypothetical protein
VQIKAAEILIIFSSESLPSCAVSRKMRWAGHVARIGYRRGVYGIWVNWQEEKRPLGRPRRRWEDNIKMDLREMVIDGANWIQLVQDRVWCRAFVSMVMNLRVP